MKKALKVKELKPKINNKNYCKYTLKLMYTLSTSTEMAKELIKSGVNVEVAPSEKYFDVMVPINKTSMIDNSRGKNLPVCVKRTINEIINTLNSQYKDEYGDNCYIDKVLKIDIISCDDDSKIDLYRGRIYS